MKLFHITQKINQWLQRGTPHSGSKGDASEALLERRTNPNALSAEATARRTEVTVNIDPRRDLNDQRGMKPKVIEWRRRVLVKKGARMHASMLERSDSGSLSMLDALGMVVSWYEGSGRLPNGSSQSAVLTQHVAQFYMPTDVATNVPAAHLQNAAAAGSSTERGWRRRSDGSTYWATTVIEPIALEGGPVQGFSHIIRESKDPLSA